MLTTVWPVTVTAEVEVKNATSAAVNPPFSLETGSIKRRPPRMIKPPEAIEQDERRGEVARWMPEGDTLYNFRQNVPEPGASYYPVAYPSRLIH